MSIWQRVAQLLSGRRGHADASESGGEAVSQTGAGAGGITADLGSSNAQPDELSGSAGQPGGTGASGSGGQSTGGT